MLKNGIILVLLCLLTVGLTAWLSHHRGTPAAVVTDFSYTDVTGRPGRLSAITEETVLVHFWATWCAPCLEELPQLLSVARDRTDTRFLILSVDRDQSAMMRFLKEIDYPQASHITYIHDPDMAITEKHFNVTMFPESLILGPNNGQKNGPKNGTDRPLRRRIVGPADWTRVDFH